MLSSFLPNQQKWSERQDKVIAILTEEFTLSTETLEQLTVEFVHQMHEGLSLPTEKSKKDLAMIPTYVFGRPDGHERGSYLALDLGGTNLRVCLITLKGNHELESHQKAFKVSEYLQGAHISELMDFIALSIKEFITIQHINAKIVEHSFNSDTLELGFTFSFPVTQTAINAGKLLRWTKGFSCPGAVGKDIVQLLQEALDRNTVNVHVAALVNDTVGTLLAHSYKNPNTFIGAIFGTGTNGAYIEDTKNIKSLSNSKEQEMAINIEWGNFDKEKTVLPVTIYDNKLDRESINPGVHVFEKMISGMYLGEITRNILLHLIDQRLLFDGTSSPKLNKAWSFETEYMSKIELDTSSTMIPIAQILEQKLDVRINTQVDREIVKHVCKLVGERAARLSAVATAAVIRQGLISGTLRDHGYPLKSNAQDEEPEASPVSGTNTLADHAINVGIDGSVFEHYPHFEDRMKAALSELLGSKANDVISLGIARDGSGVGAALAALIATKNTTASV